MKKVSLSGSSRKNVGKKDAKSQRREGQVPAVIYGGKTQVHVTVNEIALKKVVYSPNVYQIELDVDGAAKDVIIQDIQFHPVTDRIVHVDFLELLADKEVKIGLPVRTEGLSAGVRNGGRLAMNFRTINAKGLPSAFPEEISIDITELEIGDFVRISSVDIPGLTLLHPENAVILAVKRTRAAMAAASEEGEEGEEGEETAEESAAE